MTYKELVAKAKELKELKIMAQELADQIAALEGEVKAEMTEQNTDTLMLETVKITWKPYTSSRFDGKAFKLTHEDLYKQYTRTYESKRFTVA